MDRVFTVSNVAILTSFVMSLYAVLKNIAPKTKTEVDDKIVNLVEKARPWVYNFASITWTIVENMGKSGKVDKLQKYSEYMNILRDGFKQAYGEEMPQALESDAQLIAQGLSAAEKLDKVNSLNPTAPAKAKEASALKPQA